MSEIDTDTDNAWLSPEAMELVRSQIPIVYVDAVPVRVDPKGNVTEVGLLLRVASDGSISRMAVSGRVLFGERIREALMRHCEKDLGPLALPRIPANPSPFTVVEYFPDPDRSGFYDPRHHAVSLAYVVPVDGNCEPTQQALDLAWFTPAEAVSAEVREQMTGGHDRLIRLALAHVDQLP
ncbi:NUDIX hydrolase family protein [soil metagenome]